jgi:prepilin peptidase CpaA
VPLAVALTVLPWVVGVAACAIAAICDLRWRRIPNALTLGAFVLALALIIAGQGVVAGIYAVGVALVVLLAGFALFALGLIGAGDAKLLAVLAAICGSPRCVEFVLYTSLCGGVLAVFVAAWRGELGALVAHLPVRVGTSLLSGNLRQAVATKSDARLPYALAVSGGYLVVLLSITVLPALRIVQ